MRTLDEGVDGAGPGAGHRPRHRGLAVRVLEPRRPGEGRDRQGFVEQGTLHAIQDDSPVPDYAFPGIENERVATGLAGFVGTLGVFAIGFGAAWLLRRRDDDVHTQAAVGGRAL